jgi:predicted enzyme related to lactoylglutathione lyase
MIKHMAFVSYSVKDVPRAAAFYRDVMRPGASDFGDEWIEFDVGDTTIGVGNGEGIGIAPGSQFSAAFEVDDVKAMHARLGAAGVTVSALSESPVCLSCFVTDPDGNRFALHQRTV